MTVQVLPSAVYHCDLPIESLSAVYESSSNSRRTHSNSAPIPAWPDIEDLDRWCCLPAFRRAIFIPEQSRDITDFMLKPFDEELLCDINQVMALYPGREKEIFSAIHEGYHYLVGWLGMYSAFRLSTQSDIIHSILQTIATAPQLTPHELKQLWNEFYAANRKLVELVQKFEIYEETFANFGAFLVAPEVAETVSDKLWQAIENRYRTVFTEYSMKIHEVLQRHDKTERELDMAVGIMEVITAVNDLSLHDIYELDPASVLDPASMASMEDLNAAEWIDYYIISAAPHLESLFSKVKEFRRTALENYPIVVLSQSGNSTELAVIGESNSSVSDSDIIEEGFWESLRQQIRWSLSTAPFKVRSLICPYKYTDTPCCGKSDFIETLWGRLPKRWRIGSTPPTCKS